LFMKGQQDDGDFHRFVLPMLPCIIHISIMLAYTSFGTYAVTYIDIPSQCEKQYHLKRFIWLSIAFNTIAFITYLVFSWFVKKGDWETARARAMLLIIMHLAFSVWGGLTWQKLVDSNCEDFLDIDFQIAHEGSIALNGMYFVMLFLHEVIPHKADYTLMPVFIDEKQKAAYMRRRAALQAAQKTQQQKTPRVQFKKVTPDTMDQHKLQDPENGDSPKSEPIDRWGAEDAPLTKIDGLKKEGTNPFSAAHIAWRNQLID